MPFEWMNVVCACAYSNVCFWHYSIPLKSIACKSAVTDVSIILDYTKMSIRLSHFRFPYFTSIVWCLWKKNCEGSFFFFGCVYRLFRWAIWQRLKIKHKNCARQKSFDGWKAEEVTTNETKRTRIEGTKNRIKLLSRNYLSRALPINKSV